MFVLLSLKPRSLCSEQYSVESVHVACTRHSRAPHTHNFQPTNTPSPAPPSPPPPPSPPVHTAPQVMGSARTAVRCRCHVTARLSPRRTWEPRGRHPPPHSLLATAPPATLSACQATAPAATLSFGDSTPRHTLCLSDDGTPRHTLSVMATPPTPPPATPSVMVTTPPPHPLSW